MLQRKEEELIKRQTIEKRALPKRIRAERKARDMMFRESLRISIHHDPKAEEDKIKKVKKSLQINPYFFSRKILIKIIAKILFFFLIFLIYLNSSKNKKRSGICKSNNVLKRNT